MVFAPIIAYQVGQFFDDYVLTPQIQGKSTDMDVPSILFATIAGGAIAGIYGLLLAIPVAACIKILLREIFWPKFRRWATGQEKDFLPIDRA
jgi:predicted PurR-regulated permease PerM